MITSKDDRMLELLWFVGYCVEFPTQLAARIGGHPEWNRHVMYRAIEQGYVEVARGRSRQRIIRSMRLTEKGLDYVSSGDPKALSYILAKQDENPTAHSSIDKILRQHSLTIALLMAYNAGAEILPDRKPSLMSANNPLNTRIPIDPEQAYFYSTAEIRRSIQEYEPDTVVKGSRISGIIVRGRKCYCLYHTGHTRMFWMRSVEENTVAAIETMLGARGFRCESTSQVIIGTRMNVAEKIAHHQVNARSRYFTVSDHYQNCFFVVNSALGDALLSIIIDPDKRQIENRKALMEFNPPAIATREYDAVTRDGLRTVILNYQCDLLALLNICYAPYGFSESPILLCYDYQVDTLQTIVGPLIEVRSINGGEWNEKENPGGRI